MAVKERERMLLGAAVSGVMMGLRTIPHQEEVLVSNVFNGHDQPNEAVQRDEAWEVYWQLIARWLRTGSFGDDDELLPPDPEAARAALHCADVLRREGGLPPTRVAPSGDGGIVFERRSGPSLSVIEFYPGGRVESRRFERGDLVDRGISRG